MPHPKTATIASLSDMAAFTNKLAQHLTPPLRLYLCGDLGAGKTTFAQHLLAALGEPARVRSPSYALAYTYHIGTLTVHHIDCYRLQGNAIGDDLQELLQDNALCLLEWPERATALPPADIYIHFNINNDESRTLSYYSNSAAGASALPQ